MVPLGMEAGGGAKGAVADRESNPPEGRFLQMKHAHISCRRIIERERKDERSTEPSRVRRGRRVVPLFQRVARSSGQTGRRYRSGSRSRNTRLRARTIRAIGSPSPTVRRTRKFGRPGGRPSIVPRLHGAYGGFVFQPRHALVPGSSRREARQPGISTASSTLRWRIF